MSGRTAVRPVPNAKVIKILIRNSATWRKKNGIFTFLQPFVSQYIIKM